MLDPPPPLHPPPQPYVYVNPNGSKFPFASVPPTESYVTKEFSISPDKLYPSPSFSYGINSEYGGAIVAKSSSHTFNAHPLPAALKSDGSSVATTPSTLPSAPTSPFGPIPETPQSRASSSTYSATVDPLLQYISSQVSNTSGGSRGPLAAWQLRFQDIQIERAIGEGSWGRVYKGIWNETEVAVKILLDTTTGATEASGSHSALMAPNSVVMARLEQEASLMTTLHHPNILQFLGVTMSPAAIMTEYCSRGSMTSVLVSARSNPDRAKELTWSNRMCMLADCCRGMLYLHNHEPNPIVHRDLKSPNLLVTGHGKVKVADFNLSKIMEDSTRSSSLQAMNPRWLSPEVLAGKPATKASDVFAFGVIMWELMTWDLPWGAANPWGIVGQVSAGHRLPIPPPEALPGPDSGAWPGLREYVALMNRCWAQEADERPSFEQIMKALQEIDSTAASVGT